MQINVEEHGDDHVVYKLEGHLNAGSADILKRSFKEAVTSGAKCLMLICKRSTMSTVVV
jgi:hypothetical protein